MTRDEKLNEIAIQVQYWLDWQEKERKDEGILCADGTHLMLVPTWPTRGMLKAWVAILKTLNE